MRSTLRRAGLLSASLLVAAACSPEAPPEGAGDEAAGMSRADDQARGPGAYTIVGGDTVLLPRRDLPPRGLGLGVNGRHVLFLNTEGVDVRPGLSNAMENVGIRDRAKEEAGVIELEPYAPNNTSRHKDILEIQKLVAGWYGDFNIDVVVSRPLSGDYMMTIVGGGKGDLGYGGGIVGISPGDCRNNNEVDLNYAFSASLGHSVPQSALTAAHEAGHAYGLGHTQNRRDIMFPSVQASVDGFESGEVADAGPCGAKMGDVQDGGQVLSEVLGVRDPASQRPGSGSGPSVRFISPKDLGDTPVAVGADLTVAVAAEARLGIDHVTVAVSAYNGDKPRGGHPVAELRPPASAAKVKFSAAGDYQLVATAYDRAGNAAIAQGRVKVASPTCGAPNDCTPGQRCVANVCSTPPLPEDDKKALRAWGTACSRTSECIGGICAVTPVGQICTHYCNAERLCAIPGLECVDGICLPPVVQRSTPKLGQLGGKCTRNQDCFTGECSAASLEDPTAPRYCTIACDPEVAWTCPASMHCELTDGVTGMKNRCVLGPPRDGGGPGASAGSGCSAGGAPGAAAGWAALLLLPLLRRRRWG